MLRPVIHAAPAHCKVGERSLLFAGRDGACPRCGSTSFVSLRVVQCYRIEAEFSICN